MRSTHEPFDDEVRGRLLDYTEEPSEHVWQIIAPKIVSVKVEPHWVVWSTRLSVIIVFSLILLFYKDNDRFSERAGVNHMTLGTPHIDNKAMSDSSQAEDRHISKENGTTTNVTQINLGALAAIEQGGIFPLPAAMRSSPSLPLVESVGVIFEPSVTDTAKSVQIQRDKLSSEADSTEKKELIRLRKNQRRQKQFSFYFLAMPTFGYQRIESNNRDNLLIEGITRIPALSVDRLGVRIEAGAEVPLSKRWKALGGVVYYQRKQTIEYIETHVDSIMIGQGADGNVSIEPQFSSLEKSTEYELRNIGVQIGFTYQLWIKDRKVMAKEALSSKSLPIRKRRLSHAMGTGIEFHKSLRENDSFKTNESFLDPATYVFVNLYYRLQYPNTGRLRAILQPTLNYSFYINEDLNAPFYVKPYGLGLNFGCAYHLR